MCHHDLPDQTLAYSLEEAHRAVCLRPFDRFELAKSRQPDRRMLLTLNLLLRLPPRLRCCSRMPLHQQLHHSLRGGQSVY